MPEHEVGGVKVKVPPGAGKPTTVESVPDGNTIHVSDGHLIVSRFSKVVAVYAPGNWVSASAPADAD